MPTKKYPLAFETITSKLREWHEQNMADLRLPETHDQALQLKRQLEAAIKCLEFCQQYQIHSTSQVVVLPDMQNMTPSCSYRVVEDQETEKREHWLELKIDGERLRLCPSDIIISEIV